MKTHQVIIVGGGPGGCVAAAVLAEKGVDVLVLEREEYPRFHIGESLLPASMPLFKEIGFYPKLASGKYIRKYGARFVDYKTDDEIYFGFGDGLNADIPMAFEVERAEFDADLLQFARDKGAQINQPENVVSLGFDETGAWIKTDKDEYQCEYLIDVSGRDSVIGKKLDIRDVNKDINNVAVFAHYKGVKRMPGKREGDITIGLLPNRAWTWIIPFQGDITSVGVVCGSDFFDGERDFEKYLKTRLEESAIVRDFMRPATRHSEIRRIGNYSHTCRKFFGDRWILSGDAALFLDPIFSSGVHMSISSSKLAAEAVLKVLPSKQSLASDSVGANYEKQVRVGAMRFKSLISMFYEGSFVDQMKKTLTRENIRKGFTSAVAGDVWNENNFLFEKQIL